MSDPTQPPPPEGNPYQPPSGDTPAVPPPPPSYGATPPPPPPPSYGQPPTYGQPPAYGGAPMGYAAPQNGQGTTALITGILGLVCCPLIGIIAIITGRKGMQLADAGQATNRGMAQAGMILGWVALALFVIGVIVAAATGSFSGNVRYN